MRRDAILYYREGITATVSVHQSRPNYRYLKTNGKVDGSYGDALTMLMTGYLPLFLHPKAERVGIIGLGTAMTVKAVGAFPVKSIEVLEIEPAMVDAAGFFAGKNGNILADPRVRVVPSDGRNYILATPHSYDIIISEPSNPWIAGIASLYTREFYARAKNKLQPNGLFAQWFHNYSMSPDDFRMVFRTFGESFPYVTIWNMKESDYLLVGTLHEQTFDYAELRRIFNANQALQTDFMQLGFTDPYAVLGMYRMDRQSLLAFAKGAEINTDDNVRLEFSAPRSLGKTTPDLNRSLIKPFLTLPPRQFDADGVTPAQRHYFTSQAYRGSGWYDEAIAEIDKALVIEPQNAAYHLLRAQVLTAQDKISVAAESAVKALDGGRAYAGPVLTLTEDFYTTQAEAVYQRILKKGWHETPAYLGLSDIAFHRKRIKEAEVWARKAALLSPKERVVMLALGRIEWSKGNHVAAKNLLEEVRKQGDDSAALNSLLGEVYSHFKDWQAAESAYKSALRHDRRNTAWRSALARVLVEMGKTEEAVEKYREILALEPNSPDAWRGLRYLGRRY
jgi:spermidine synthase/Tfp pilus assembly protein PilF